MRPLAHVRLEMRRVGEEVIVHDPVHGKVHVLNRAAAFILERCDGEHSAEEIAGDMATRTGTQLTEVRRDVASALEAFAALHLID